MVGKRSILGVSLALALLLAQGEAAAQVQDPESVLRAVVAAGNAHNVEGMLALFADDAVVIGPGEALRPTTFRGKAEIRALFLAPPGSVDNPTTRAELGSVQVAGDRATAPFRLFANDIAATGVPFLQGSISAALQGGKIVSLTIAVAPPGQPAPTGPAMAPATQPARAPAQLPRTGSDGAGLIPLGLAVGGLLAGAGLGFRRRGA
jgi:LPXTG-motif cell wall-anchored protein